MSVLMTRQNDDDDDDDDDDDWKPTQKKLLRKHCLYLLQKNTPPQQKTEWAPFVSDLAASSGEVTLREFFGIWSTSSLPLRPGPD